MLRGRGVFRGRLGAGDHPGSDDQVVDLTRRVIELPEPAEPAKPAEPAVSASERAAWSDLGERLNWLAREARWDAGSPPAQRPAQGPAQRPLPPRRSLSDVIAPRFLARNSDVSPLDASLPADDTPRVHDLRRVHDPSRRDEDDPGGTGRARAAGREPAGCRPLAGRRLVGRRRCSGPGTGVR